MAPGRWLAGRRKCVRLGGQLLFQKHGGVLPYRETPGDSLPLVTAPTYPGVVQACLHSVGKPRGFLRTCFQSCLSGTPGERAGVNLGWVWVTFSCSLLLSYRASHQAWSSPTTHPPTTLKDRSRAPPPNTPPVNRRISFTLSPLSSWSLSPRGSSSICDHLEL